MSSIEYSVIIKELGCYENTPEFYFNSYLEAFDRELREEKFHCLEGSLLVFNSESTHCKCMALGYIRFVNAKESDRFRDFFSSKTGIDIQ